MNPASTDNTKREALYWLRHARGHYPADRAAQLSGIPISTLYDWQRNDIYRPDYRHGTPMAWSYRDLVYLRVLAWLRAQRMPRPLSARRVAELKAHVAAGNDVRELHADRQTLVLDRDVDGSLGGTPVLFVDMLGRFDLAGAAVEELGDSPLWGPDLVAPTAQTYISPWVLGGEPCIIDTRIPTAAVYVLCDERALDVADVVELYPGLNPGAVEDAYLLERRLRGYEKPLAA